MKHIARPLLWPECERLIAQNPNFVLMEDGAPSHTATYTNMEREKRGIPKAVWPPFSPDFNPIERIWNWMKKEISSRVGKRVVSTVEEMRQAMYEAWEALSVERINREIEKLPEILVKCINVNGNNNYHAWFAYVVISLLPG